MKNNIISLKNVSHLSLAALALLEVNNLGIISSELLSSYSTTYLYPALAAGTIILGVLNTYLSAKTIDECFDNYRNPLAQSAVQDFKDNDLIKAIGDNLVNFTPIAAFFLLTTTTHNLGYFPLLCFTSILHLNLVVFNDKADALLKTYIPEEDLKLYNQDTFASRVLNKLSSTIGLNIA
ncbi:hypothetical protein I862_00530 [endosymbiont of Acanthamoeba sp. UWC8]|uniref:hypothetical protein n=1 Tax=endosymbiont of Acanthamoeba sp. UWC8 TaxID=86106 RepID=UPI0004D1932F|nr:hypothetical protein [endosymbiont of Acanthamoeba sp. UWC8]AIF80671.1 hypothetical protein I862_00530 [endosymbiont of Acanthamoeba sp. UWC8]